MAQVRIRTIKFPDDYFDNRSIRKDFPVPVKKMRFIHVGYYTNSFRKSNPWFGKRRNANYTDRHRRRCPEPNPLAPVLRGAPFVVPSFPRAVVPSGGAPEKHRRRRRTGARERHARWISSHPHRVRAVLALLMGFGEHPRGLFPGWNRVSKKRRDSLPFSTVSGVGSQHVRNAGAGAEGDKRSRAS